MKKKTISKNIKSKMDSFKKSLPKDLQKGFEENVIVTGGCIVSMFLQEKVNDYDIYIKSPEFLIKLLKHYKQLMSDKYSADHLEVKVYKGNTNTEKLHVEVKPGDRICMFIRSAGIYNTPKDLKKFHPAMITDNALSFKGDVQLITRFWGDAKEIHRNFDYVHVRSYWTYETGVISPPDALEAILTRELKYRGSLYPLASIIRMRKFLKRGWSITAGEIVKMAFQTSELDLKDPAVLADQLMGVDMSYFAGFIDKIRKAIEEKKDISPTYVMEILDEIFEQEHETDND